MSEDESSNERSVIDVVLNKQRKQPSRYQCPADFVTFSQKPCAGMRIENACNDNTELWLIKAPSSFNPDSLSSLKMPLSGLQTIKASAQQVQGDSVYPGQIYSVLGGPLGSADFRILTSHRKKHSPMVCGPLFSGMLNICESFGDCGANQAPMAIPATPAPTVPPGLRQRFQPFGSKTPTRSMSIEDTPSTPEMPLSAMRQAGEESQKKKKREKRLKTEDLEKVIRVNPELLAMTHCSQGHPEEGSQESEHSDDRTLLTEESPKKKKKREKHLKTEELEEVIRVKQEAELSEERRKKKKKRKDRETEEAGDVVGSPANKIKEEEIEVKVEPLDCSYDDVESGKKKKKKKNKHADD